MVVLLHDRVHSLLEGVGSQAPDKIAPARERGETGDGRRSGS